MVQPTAPDLRPAHPEVIRCDLSGDFAGWMSRAGGSIVLTTYQAGKVVMIGWNGRQVTVLPRQFSRPMGLAVAGRQLLVATQYHLIQFANTPELAHEFQENQPGRYDALYLPRVTYHTGMLNLHDVAFGDEGTWLVNTRFSCLASPSAEHAFTPRWRPPFVSATVPEDRCHLNGLALEEGRPRFVTALGESDEVGGWRADIAGGGILIDVPTGDIVMRGLCMPHSPRLHGGTLWLLNSGAGELWCVDRASFRHEVVCTLPGYLRGLCFVGPYALIGMCMVREKHIFRGLPVQERFPKLHCAVAVVDLRSGREVGRFEFTEGCTELYDVQFLPGVLRPMILSAEQEAATQACPAADGSYWLRPGALIPDETVKSG